MLQISRCFFQTSVLKLYITWSDGSVWISKLTWGLERPFLISSWLMLMLPSRELCSNHEGLSLGPSGNRHHGLVTGRWQVSASHQWQSQSWAWVLLTTLVAMTVLLSKLEKLLMLTLMSVRTRMWQNNHQIADYKREISHTPRLFNYNLQSACLWQKEASLQNFVP